MILRFTPSSLALGLVLFPVAAVQAQDHLSETEKAAAIVAVGSFSAASAQAAGHDQGPDLQDPGKVVVMNIQNSAGERVPVYLYPRNGGWFGPRGEFYRKMPSTRYLAAVYGSRSRDGGAHFVARDQGGGYQDIPLQAKVAEGRVTISRNGKAVSVVRTAFPKVEKWEFINHQAQIVVKSRDRQGAAIVEKFNTRTGTLEDKVAASTIRKSRTKWPKGFED